MSTQNKQKYKHPNKKYMAKRTFRIYGQASNDANIDVYVDNTLTISGPIDVTKTDPFGEYGLEIFTFTTDNRAHGYSNIKIVVNSGEITLAQHRVSYFPETAIARGVYGTAYIIQPINDPKYLAKINGTYVKKDNEDLPGEWHYNLSSGDIFEYYHLYFNSPDFFDLTLNDAEFQDFKETKIINIHDPAEPKSVNPIFQYKNKPLSIPELTKITENLILSILENLITQNKNDIFYGGS